MAAMLPQLQCNTSPEQQPLVPRPRGWCRGGRGLGGSVRWPRIEQRPDYIPRNPARAEHAEQPHQLERALRWRERHPAHPNENEAPDQDWPEQRPDHLLRSNAPQITNRLAALR